MLFKPMMPNSWIFKLNKQQSAKLANDVFDSIDVMINNILKNIERKKINEISN